MGVINEDIQKLISDFEKEIKLTNREKMIFNYAFRQGVASSIRYTAESLDSMIKDSANK